MKVEQARALDPNPPQPVKKYKDSEGKPRYHGTADLTKTEPGNQFLLSTGVAWLRWSL